MAATAFDVWRRGSSQVVRDRSGAVAAGAVTFLDGDAGLEGERFRAGEFSAFDRL